MNTTSRRDLKAAFDYNGKRYILKGFLHLRYGTFPGEVEVTSINDIPTQQILPGMPEITYSYTLQHLLILPTRPLAASFTLKMDGTAVLFSPLSLPTGEVVVFPRTRGMVVMQDTQWRPLRTLVNQALSDNLLERITQVCQQQKATLVFELWGSINPHTVQYHIPLQLSLHTMIKGRTITQPWRLVKQVAKAYDIPTVDELVRLVPPHLSEDSLMNVGQELVNQQEKQNNPQMGLYRQEGIVLNVETPSKGFQWKFKPPSMEEYHQLARVKICPVTVFHSIWKMVDHGENISLAALQENMAKEYGKDTVLEQLTMIEHHYWLWYSNYFAQIVAAVDVQSDK